MARIVVGSYMVRYPLGGMMSWVLQYLIGFHQLGHDVYVVEKSRARRSCFDPRLGTMTDDCAYGVSAVENLLARYGLAGRLCHVDRNGDYHGMSRDAIEGIFRTADLFIDMGSHGAWTEEASTAKRTVLLDGEPGYTQMKMALRERAGSLPPRYDAYFTNGLHVGAPDCSVPSAGRAWSPVVHPVATAVFGAESTEPVRGFTTVMNWQSHDTLTFEGRAYGQKDVEFSKFLQLPRHTRAGLEAAVAGRNVPHKELESDGWTVIDAHATTATFDSFIDYVRSSTGEFSVCKEAYVAMKTGWFSDRSGMYMAKGRPVVQQDTGFGEHLPVGRGLFAVATPDEAAAAIDAILTDYETHARAAREIACDVLDARVVLRNFLDDPQLAGFAASLGEPAEQPGNTEDGASG